jgi:hypothetical protein
MQETEILNALDKITLNSFSDDEKSIILAHVVGDKNIKTANNLNRVLLQKIAEYSGGAYEESGNTKKNFQDFSETGPYPSPFVISNKKEIDAFLDKMMGKEDWEGDFFDDTFEFYHPKENMNADGVPRHRSDFNSISDNS